VSPPHVALEAPSGTVSGTVRVVLQASDDEELARVELRAGGALLAVLDAPPFEASWDTTSLPDGQVVLEARAVDRARNAASDSRTLQVLNHPGSTPPLAPPPPASPLAAARTRTRIVLSRVVALPCRSSIRLAVAAAPARGQ